MKIIVRSLAIALALTGFVATTATTHASAKTSVASAKTSAMPAPRCPLDQPDGCGIGQW